MPASKTKKMQKSDKSGPRILLKRTQGIWGVEKKTCCTYKKRLAKIRQHQFHHRVVNNLLHKVYNTQKVKQRYSLKFHIENLVHEAFSVKRLFFIQILNRMKNLDKSVTKMVEQCVTHVKLTPKNFCTVLGGKWEHTSNTERFYQEEMYFSQKKTTLAVRESGRCYQLVDGKFVDNERILQTSEPGIENSCNEQCNVSEKAKSTVNTLSEEILDVTNTNKVIKKYKWDCTKKCNIRLKSCQLLRRFLMEYNRKRGVRSKMKMLYGIDKCPMRQLTGLLGHSIACLQKGACPSLFHHIRMLASHHTGMRAFVNKIYKAKSPIILLEQLNKYLTTGTVEEVRTILKEIKEIYFDADMEEDVEQTAEGIENSTLSMDYLLAKFGKQMAAFDSEASELPLSECASCRRLNYKHQVNNVHLCAKVENNEKTAWAKMLMYLMIEERFDVFLDVIFCKYCYSSFEMNKIPSRSVLNGMDLDPIPECLQNLNPCESVALQTIHPFKMIVRLHPKTAKIPSKELSHGLKGKIVYLPIDLQQNVETLHLEDESSEAMTVLVNGVPTKDGKIWQQIMNIDKLRSALQYLKENNQYYKDLDVEGHLMKNVPQLERNQSKGQFEHVSVEDRVHLYQQYTVHPLDNTEVLGDSLELFQMQKSTGAPISLFEKSLEERCFPMLFPKGRGGRFEDREIRITAAEYRNARFLSAYAFLRRHLEYLFHTMYFTEFCDLCHAIGHIFSTGSTFKNLTAGQMVQKIDQKDQVLESKITNIFASMRGTKPYWLRRNSELRCMMRHLGPPTWFLTLSCAEYSWFALADFIRTCNQDVKNIKKMSNGELCAMDPILMARYYHHRWLAMLHFILNKENPPLGLVIEYFWRKEYQKRGAPHVHCLLWILGAPKFGDNSDDEVLAFIQKYVTCDIPKENENAQLREKVLKFQQHKCGKPCHRIYKSKQRVYTKCRYAFPRPVKEFGEVYNFLSSVRHNVSRKSPKNTYNLRRSLESRNINDYNPAVLLMWDANIDLQFIADNAEAVARYVTAYVTKAEKSVADSVWTELAANKGEKGAAFSYGLRLLHDRVCGEQEGADRIIGQPLYGRSKNVLWISIGPADERKRVLKSLHEIKLIAELDANRTDIVKNNFIDTYYPQRCDVMEDMCLFEVAENYRFRSLNPDVEKGRFPLKHCDGSLVHHKKSNLINHYRLSMETEEKKEKSYFCYLQLFKPWRKESDLLGNHKTYEAAFFSAKEQIKNPKFIKYLALMDQEAQKEKQLDEELRENTPESSQSSISASQQLLGEPNIQTDVDIAMEEVEVAMQVANDVEINLQILVHSFNEGQKIIFDKIVIELEMSFAHAAGDCQCVGNHQILRYISGEAGTGKSYLIRALRAYLQEKTGQVNCCVVAAPTGIAAFNVNGVTLHRLLMLPVEQEQRLEYNKLNPDTAQSIGRVMRQVKLLIIDEISMVSNLMLAFVHLRLQEVLRSSRTIPFGGIHVVAFGDLLQLTPVKGQPVFQTLSSKDANKSIGSIGNVNLWRYFTYYELTQNMRQADDLHYSKMLEGIRVGMLKKDVEAMLESRLVRKLFPKGCSGEQLMTQLQSDGIHTVALMPKTVQCDSFNLNMMKMEKNDIVVIESNDSLDGETVPLNLDLKVQKRLKDMESKVSNTAGLDRNLKLCINSRVMLRRNLNVEIGLVNGAMGHVISFEKDRTGNYCSVKVQFDKQKCPSLITRVTARFKLFKDVYVRRSQFPLCASYAITVHKSQGLSLDSAIVSIGKDVFKEGIVYVALSRVRQLSGLYILDFKPSEVKADSSCLMEYNRLRKQDAPHLKPFDLPIQFGKRKHDQQKPKDIEEKNLACEDKKKFP